MSQRTALLVSLVLTVLVGVAIVGNRDSLLGASPAPAEDVSTTVTTGDAGNIEGTTKFGTQTRVVEVTLPTTEATEASRDDDRFDDDRFEDDDHDEDHDDDRDDDHEEDDHEDADYEDDDDD